MSKNQITKSAEVVSYVQTINSKGVVISTKVTEAAPVVDAPKTKEEMRASALHVTADGTQQIVFAGKTVHKEPTKCRYFDEDLDEYVISEVPASDVLQICITSTDSSRRVDLSGTVKDLRNYVAKLLSVIDALEITEVAANAKVKV